MRCSKYVTGSNACQTKWRTVRGSGLYKYMGSKWQLKEDVKGMWCAE